MMIVSKMYIDVDAYIKCKKVELRNHFILPNDYLRKTFADMHIILKRKFYPFYGHIIYSCVSFTFVQVSQKRISK